MIRDDLSRPSLQYIRYELEGIISEQDERLKTHAERLTTTSDEDLYKLKTEAQLAKVKADSARHILGFLDLDVLSNMIEAEKNKGEK